MCGLRRGTSLAAASKHEIGRAANRKWKRADADRQMSYATEEEHDRLVYHHISWTHQEGIR